MFTWGDNDEGQLGDGSTNAIQRPRLVASLQNRRINRVACGSAHTLAWSTNKPVTTSKLPAAVPLEFDLLKEFSPAVLRNRLVLLHHFSDLFCPGLAMFPLGSEALGCGVDRLRTLLVSAAKESAFRKVVQATMVRDRQHGPVLELNRFPGNKRGGRSGRGSTEDGTVFGQMVSKMGCLTADCLLLPHRIWKVKFVGESVDDCGGGYSESVAELCDELTSLAVPLLIQTPNGRDEAGTSRDCLLLNPALRTPHHLQVSPETNKARYVVK